MGSAKVEICYRPDLFKIAFVARLISVVETASGSPNQAQPSRRSSSKNSTTALLSGPARGLAAVM